MVEEPKKYSRLTVPRGVEPSMPPLEATAKRTTLFETSALPAAFAVPRHNKGERSINARMNRLSFRHRFCTAAPSGRR
jgi:hypothetical protein